MSIRLSALVLPADELIVTYTFNEVRFVEFFVR